MQKRTQIQRQKRTQLHSWSSYQQPACVVAVLMAWSSQMAELQIFVQSATWAAVCRTV